MDHPTPTQSTTFGRVRPLAFALVAVMAMALPVSAQEAAESAAPATVAPEPAAESAASETPVTETAAPEGATLPARGIAFPVMLGGQLLTPRSYTGEEWLDQFREGDAADPAFVAGTEALLESVGASLDDLAVKTAMYEPTPGQAAVVVAMRIDDTEAREWVELAVDVMVSDVIEPGLVMRPLETKWTLRVTDATMPGVYPRTIYFLDDTAWIIQGDLEYVEDALAQLPDADPVAPSAADSLYTDVPMSLGGVRRLGLYESTEPLFMPTLGERLGDAFGDWLLDLYLEAGLTPAEMLGVIAWWGFDPTQDGIQIEGYRLPEGSEQWTQQLLDDVFLVRPPEVSVNPDVDGGEVGDDIEAMLSGVVFGEEEIAGRSVTTLDFGGPRQYIFGSPDTIWVVTDPMGERALVEEAIEALP